MRYTILAVMAALCLALASSHPLPEDGLRSEALDRLVMAEADNEAALRSKRTIGILRQLFPDITQRIDSIVNSIISEVIRVLGPTIFRSILGGGAGAAGGGTNTPGVERTDDGTSVIGMSPFGDEDESNVLNGSKVSLALPTFPPDEDEASSSSSPIMSSSIGDRANFDATTISAVTSTTTTSTTTPSVSENEDVNPESENRVNEIGSESQNSEVRVQFADEVPSDNSPQELTPLDETEAEEDENRNKRFLFGLGGSGGSAGSGNFLFDIIRQAADGAARAAGTVYRVVAGTQSLGLGLSASRDVGPAAPAVANPAGGTGTPKSGASTTAAPGAGILPPLVAGSGSNQLGSSSGGTDGKSDETHEEAVPGPVTRFFVIANRGLSNLVQDIILRLAATSERFVNFKARLITSII